MGNTPLTQLENEVSSTPELSYEEWEVVCGVLANGGLVDTTSTVGIGEYLGGEEFGILAIGNGVGASWDNNFLYKGKPTIRIDNVGLGLTYLGMGLPGYIAGGNEYGVRLPIRGTWSAGNVYVALFRVDKEGGFTGGSGILGLNKANYSVAEWLFYKNSITAEANTYFFLPTLLFISTNGSPLYFSITEPVYFQILRLQSIQQKGKLFSSLEYITTFDHSVNQTIYTNSNVIPVTGSKIMVRIASSKRITYLALGKGNENPEGKDVKIAVCEIDGLGNPGTEVSSVFYTAAEWDAMYNQKVEITSFDDVPTGEYYLVISNETDSANITFGLNSVLGTAQRHSQFGERFRYYSGGVWQQDPTAKPERIALELHVVAPCLGFQVKCNGVESRLLLDQDGTFHNTILDVINNKFATPDLVLTTEDGSTVATDYSGGDALIRTEWYEKGTATFGDNNVVITATTPETGFILTPIQVGLPITDVDISIVLENTLSNTVGVAYSTDLESWTEFGSVTSTDGIEKGLASLVDLNKGTGTDKIFVSLFKKGTNDVIIQGLSISGKVNGSSLVIPTVYPTGIENEFVESGPQDKSVTSITYIEDDIDGYPHLSFSDGSIVAIPIDVRGGTSFTVDVIDTTNEVTSLVATGTFTSDGDVLSFDAQDKFDIKITAIITENYVEATSPNVNVDITKPGSGRFKMRTLKTTQGLEQEIDSIKKSVNELGVAQRAGRRTKTVLQINEGSVVRDGNKGHTARLNLTDDITFERIYNVASQDDDLTLVIEQDSVGGHTITRGSEFTGNTTLRSGAGEKTTFTIVKDGEDFLIDSDASSTMTDAEVKTAYENNPDTNAFTDAEKAKLGDQSGINTGDQDISGIGDNASAISSLTTVVNGKVGSTGPTTISKLRSGTQAEYDALGSYDSNTIYFVE